MISEYVVSQNNPDIPAKAETRRYAWYIAGLALGFVLAALLWWPLAEWQLGGSLKETRITHLAFETKAARAAATPHVPHLFFVAGSSGGSGIRAADVEAATRLPSVNLGVNGSFCIDLALYKTRQFVRPGDTVVLAFEYESYREGWQPNETLLNYVCAEEPEYLNTLSLRKRLQYLYSLAPNRLFSGLLHRAFPVHLTVREQNSVRDSMNANGDTTRNRLALRTPEMQKSVMDSEAPLAQGVSPKTEARAQLTIFREWCRRRNISILATFPNLYLRPAYHTAAAQSELRDIERLYRGLDIPVLGKPEDFMYPDINDFFDSKYHLTDVASRPRTAQLISLLKPYIKRHL